MGPPFWKYHIVRVSRDNYYLSTNVDSRHRDIPWAPSYFVRVETHGSDFKLTISQSHHNTSPMVVEKTKDMLRVSFRPNETLVNGSVLNDAGEASNKLVQYKFGKGATDQGARTANDTVQRVNEYSCGELCVCELKAASSGLFKTKVDGIKLGKDGSVYFLKGIAQSSISKGHINETLAWYDTVCAFFRPCNREVASRMTKSVLKSSRLLGSSGSVSTSSVASTELSDDDTDASADVSASSVSYVAQDGLFQRHPLDDSPNDHKLGWLTLYDQGGYFGTTGRWQLALGASLGLAMVVNTEKFTSC